MPATYAIGQVLPNGARVTTDEVTTAPDGSTVEHIVAHYPNGAWDEETIFTPGPGTPEANRQMTHQRVRDGLIDHATYLADPATTFEALVAQVEALTRQVNRLARIVLNEHDTTAGT